MTCILRILYLKEFIYYYIDRRKRERILISILNAPIQRKKKLGESVYKMQTDANKKKSL